jgi:hypothetical protein
MTSEEIKKIKERIKHKKKKNNQKNENKIGYKNQIK